MHCSDEQLISYLDGELPILRRIGVHAHLRRCWHCRGRLAVCEREIVSLSEAAEQWSFPDAGWKNHARSRLNGQFESIERTLPNTEAVRLDRVALFALAVCAALFCALVWIPHLDPPSIDALHAVERATSAELALFRSAAVKQQIAVVVEEIRPVRVVRRSRVEAISDYGTGRYTASLRDEHGVVQQVLWKPDDHSEYVYQPGRSAAVGKRSLSHRDEQLLDAVGESVVNAEQMEVAFMRWLESRSWRPIALSADLAVLAHRNDTLLRMEKVQNTAGNPTLRLTASRTNKNQVVARVTLELDPTSYRPRLETLRLERDGRQVELRISVTDVQEVSGAALAQISFLPPSSQAPSVSRSDTEGTPLPRSIPAPEPESVAALPANPDGRVQAMFALHQAGACLGSGVEISDTPVGIIVRERTANGSDPRRLLAEEASMAEVLSALGEIRDSIETDRALLGQIREHAAALRLFVRMPSRTSLLLSESSRVLLQAMLHDHIVLLTQALDNLPPKPEPDTPNPNNLLPPKPVPAKFSERITALADALDNLDLTASRDHLQALRTQAKALDAENRNQLATSR